MQEQLRKGSTNKYQDKTCKAANETAQKWKLGTQWGWQVNQMKHVGEKL